ncbi:hypothetical protein ASG81_19515 [Paenibacillus sp. Soil522]|nr:hypothetical protein ASG81_19515 [Paenibacillus sp. Soil522]
MFFNMERMRQPLPKAAQELTYKGYLALHHHLFQDIYTWAGQQREYTTGRDAAPFAPPENIQVWSLARYYRRKYAGKKRISKLLREFS